MDDLSVLGVTKIIANNPEILVPDRPIAFNRDFVKTGMGIKAALFLSQAIYWSKRTKDKDGWFYKTVEEWEDETGLTTDEQRGVKKTLKDMNILIVEKRGLPAKNYFKVNTYQLACMLINAEWKNDSKARQSRENPSTLSGNIPAHTIAESTQRKAIDKSIASYEEIVEVEDSKKVRKKRDTTAWSTREHLYKMFEKEKGVRPTPNAGDYNTVLNALKRLTQKQVIDMVEDELNYKNPITVRECLTARKVDQYLQENR